mgnify:CR=1 FL=1
MTNIRWVWVGRWRCSRDWAAEAFAAADVRVLALPFPL